MIETYSKNIDVAESTAIPLNTIALMKGCTATKSGTTSIQLQRAGIYEVNISATAKLQTLASAPASAPASTTDSTAVVKASDSNVIAIQLYKDNVVQPQAYSAVTASDTTSLHPLSFTTLVQVPTNNSQCCCSSPVTVDIVNQCADATYDTIDVVVTKIC